MKKNTAGQSIGVQMTTIADGSPFTGSVTVYITKDNGIQAAGANSSGACTHEGKGYHSYAPTQADTNGDHLAFTFEATGAFTVTIQLWTEYDANAIKQSGTALTARDMGASVLLSPGTGTGQLDITSGVVKANTTQFAGSNVTASGGIPEVKVASLASGAITAAAIAADAITDAKVASDVTIASVTGAVGSVAGDVGGNVTGSVGSVAAGGITSSSFASGAITATAIAADAIGASELAADAVSEIAAAVGGGGGGLDASGVRAAIGLATANLDTQLAAIAAYIDTEIAAIKAKTDALPSDPADASDIVTSFTKIKKYLQLLLRSDEAIATANATELGELNSGGGTYDNTTDSLEAASASNYVCQFGINVKSTEGSVLQLRAHLEKNGQVIDLSVVDAEATIEIEISEHMSGVVQIIAGSGEAPNDEGRFEFEYDMAAEDAGYPNLLDDRGYYVKVTITADGTEYSTLHEFSAIGGE